MFGKSCLDPAKFLRYYTLYKKLNSWDTQKAIELVALFVAEPYHVWLYDLPVEENMSWTEYCTLFVESANELLGLRPNYIDQLEKCVKDSQESITAYALRFCSIASNIQNLCPIKQRRTFIKGLPGALRDKVIESDPRTFEQALHEAKRLERVNRERSVIYCDHSKMGDSDRDVVVPNS